MAKPLDDLTSRERVEYELLRAERPMSVSELSAITGYNEKKVMIAIVKIRSLSERGSDRLSSSPYGRKKKYSMAPLNSSGCGPVVKASTTAPDFNYDPSKYRWPHLVPIDRLEGDDHKACGSRRGEKVVPYAGPLPMCAGAGFGIYGPSAATKKSKPV